MINVFHIVSGKTWGGAEQYAYDLASRLRHDPDFYTEVVCRKTPAVLNRFRQLELPISILPLKGMADIDSPTRLARLLRKGLNIVHVHSVSDAFTAMWARRISENQHGTRIVMTVHGIDRPRDNYLYRKIYKSVDLFVFVSQMAHDAFMGHVRKRDQYKALVLRDSVIPAAPDAATPVIDLRSKEKYDAGHIPQAVNFPLRELRLLIQDIITEGFSVLTSQIIVYGETEQEGIDGAGLKGGEAGDLAVRGVEVVFQPLGQFILLDFCQ